jgi:hypothetical protein
MLVEHPLYRVRATVPDDWVAEAGYAEVYPADTWLLHPDDGNEPQVRMILGWLPRGGRQSAFFPGDRDDGHTEQRTIGGAPRTCWIENSVRQLLVDFDVNELAVSIATFAEGADDTATVDAIVERLTFDPDARAPDHPTPARRALELARAWARDHGQPADRLVYTGRPRGMTQAFAFTLFHARGLVALYVDVERRDVMQMSAL